MFTGLLRLENTISSYRLRKNSHDKYSLDSPTKTIVMDKTTFVLKYQSKMDVYYVYRNNDFLIGFVETDGKNIQSIDNYNLFNNLNRIK